MTTDTQQAALNFTIGRVTNDDLEAADGVHFKNEDEVNGEAIGPVWLTVKGQYVPLRKSDEAEWHTESLAESLAEALGVPLESI